MDSFSQVQFRKATVEDIAVLAELRIRQLIDEGYPETRDIRAELGEYFSASIRGGTLICWVGTDEGSIVATAGLCFYQLPCSFSNPTGMNAYITNVYTKNAYRQRGIASYLVGQLLSEAKSLNYSLVKLHSSEHGKRIYERAGFIEADGYMALKC